MEINDGKCSCSDFIFIELDIRDKWRTPEIDYSAMVDAAGIEPATPTV